MDKPAGYYWVQLNHKDRWHIAYHNQYGWTLSTEFSYPDQGHTSNDDAVEKFIKIVGPIKELIKCIVFGCSNHKHEGTFEGDMCLPCFRYITTGKIGLTDSFLGELAGRQHCNCGKELLPGVCSVCDEKEEEAKK